MCVWISCPSQGETGPLLFLLTCTFQGDGGFRLEAAPFHARKADTLYINTCRYCNQSR